MLLFCLLVVAVVASGSRATNPSQIDQDMIRSFSDQLKKTRKELQFLQSLDDQDVSGRSMKDIKDKIKEYCTCKSHKECSCCYKYKVDTPLIGSYLSPTACCTFQINPSARTALVNVHLGPISAFKKELSLIPLKRACTKIENTSYKDFEMENIEMCMSMDIKESKEEGLACCMKFELVIMKIFEKSMRIPCFRFKNNKLKIDDTFEESAEQTIDLNIKDWWNKLFGKKPKS